MIAAHFTLSLSDNLLIVRQPHHVIIFGCLATRCVVTVCDSYESEIIPREPHNDARSLHNRFLALTTLISQCFITAVALCPHTYTCVCQCDRGKKCKLLAPTHPPSALPSLPPPPQLHTHLPFIFPPTLLLQPSSPPRPPTLSLPLSPSYPVPFYANP